MRALLEKADGKDMLFGEVLGSFSRRSHAVVMVFVSFPLCFPVGIPVLTTSFGLTLALVGLFLALGRNLWIPRRLRDKVVPYERLAHIVERLLRVAERIERWLHPRLLPLATNGPIMRVHGVFVLIMGLTAAIPIPLLGNNLVAALPTLLLGLALLERDGVLVIVSYVSSIACVLYYGALVYLGRAGFQHLMGF